MDWNLKSQLSWDFTDFEQQQQEQTFTNSNNNNNNNNNNNTDGHNVSNIFTIDHKPTREDCFDLKLGQVPNSGSNETFPKMPSSSSSPGPTKRSRGSYNNGSQTVSCLVDGCVADLSGCRDYHRRHKVCELHSKTPKVTIAGHYQRFCQQCSRFHGLEEFDEGKRSCRKRLDGHNRRRRKPQPEPFSRYGNLLSNYQGNQLLPFPSSVMYSSPTSVDPTSARVVIKTEAIDLPQNGLFLNSSPPAKPFSLVQSHHHHNHNHNHNHRSFVRANNMTVEDHHNQPNSRHDLYGKLSSSSAAMEVQNSECVLSLLSTSAQITEMGLGHSNNNSSNDDVSNQIGSIPLIHSVGFDQMSSVLAGNGNELHYLGMYRHAGSDGSSNQDTHHQTLPSNWG